MSKVYHGFRDPSCGPVVEVITRRKTAFLPDRDDLRPYPGKGFDWPGFGPGSARLALALLADATGQARLALRLHLEYRWRVVVLLGRRDWTMTREDVVLWVLERCEDIVRHQGHWPLPEETVHA